MSYPKQLKWQPTSLRNQKVKEIIEAAVVLREDVLYFKAEFYADEIRTNDEEEPDPALGWEEGVYNYFEVVMDRSDVRQIEKSYQPKADVWCVCVFGSAYADPLKIHTETESHAERIFGELMLWRWNVDLPKNQHKQ